VQQENKTILLIIHSVCNEWKR